MSNISDIYPIMKETLDGGNTFTFPINGTSMQPLLYKDDTVTLIKRDTYKIGDIVFFIRDDGHFVLHRIRKAKNGVFMIVGDHQTRCEMVRYDQIVGVVIALKNKRKDKVNDLSSLRYKIYKRNCRSWLFRWFNAHFR